MYEDKKIKSYTIIQYDYTSVTRVLYVLFSNFCSEGT